MKKQKPPSQGVQSLDTGLAVAFMVARAGRSLALTEIAAGLKMLPSTAHRHLASLSRAGLIEQAGPSGLYDLGPSAIEFGLAALRRIDAQKLSSQAIERLRDETNLTSMVIVWGTYGPTVIQWKESRQPVWINAHVGSALPLTRSAGGLVFCAHSNFQGVATTLDSEFGARPGPTNHLKRLTRRSFESLLAKIRRDGYADIDGDLLEGVAAASAPVFDQHGNIKLAISVLGPSSQVNLDPNGVHIKSLLSVSRWLSQRLGYQQDLHG